MTISQFIRDLSSDTRQILAEILLETANARNISDAEPTTMPKVLDGIEYQIMTFLCFRPDDCLFSESQDICNAFNATAGGISAIRSTVNAWLTRKIHSVDTLYDLFLIDSTRLRSLQELLYALHFSEGGNGESESWLD